MSNWKIDFYNKYSTLFGKTLKEDIYDQYRPYGNYIVDTCFPSNKEVKILDLGCGKGGFLKVFKECGYLHVEGVDVSAEDVLYAHTFGMSEVRLGDIMETLSTASDASYDIVLFLDVIEHFAHAEILHLLTEAHRIIRHGGTIILHVPNAEGIFGSRIRYSDFTHDMAFTSKSLSQILTYAGFSSFRCFEDKPLLHNLKGILRRLIWIIGTFPFRVLHAAETGTYAVFLSQNILFRATKI